MSTVVEKQEQINYKKNTKSKETHQKMNFKVNKRIKDLNKKGKKSL